MHVATSATNSVEHVFAATRSCMLANYLIAGWLPAKRRLPAVRQALLSLYVGGQAGLGVSRKGLGGLELGPEVGHVVLRGTAVVGAGKRLLRPLLGQSCCKLWQFRAGAGGGSVGCWSRSCLLGGLLAGSYTVCLTGLGSLQ